MLATVGIEAVGASAAEACRRLSSAAGWTHQAADWHARLIAGQGLGVRQDGRLVACGLVLPGAEDAAFIGMLLTAPEARGQGHASAILAAALDLCRRDRRRAWLIAVPRAVPLYLRHGFRQAGALVSHRGAPPSRSGTGVRRALPAHLPRMLALDQAAWGSGRGDLIRDQFARFPHLAFIADGADCPVGFALAAERDGVRMLGPVVAPDASIAVALAEAALAGSTAARCDSLSQHSEFHAALGLARTATLPLMAQGPGPLTLPFAKPRHLFAAQSAAAG